MFTGVILFAVVYYSAQWPDAVDPTGKHFVLSVAGKGAIAVFLLAGTWWVFEVVPIGVTSLMIGIMQVLFLIRPANVAFQGFHGPVGIVYLRFHRYRHGVYQNRPDQASGLQNALIVGEKTSMIYLGCFVVTAALTHIMAHTAVAATIYPLLDGHLRPLR